MYLGEGWDYGTLNVSQLFANLSSYLIAILLPQVHLAGRACRVGVWLWAL